MLFDEIPIHITMNQKLHIVLLKDVRYELALITKIHP